MSYDESADIDLDNHKLIIVMDHSPYFASSSNPHKWLDSFCQDVNTIVPKSLWATMVESVMEFTRIVWNIFPKDKLIEVIASNHVAHILNNWGAETQNTEFLSEVFATVGQPAGETPIGQEASILHGLRGAMESLVNYTPLQKVKFFDDLACMAKTQYAKLNRGRIICITSLSDNGDLKVLIDLFLLEMSRYNYNASHSNFLQLPVTHCHLIIINIYPTGTSTDIINRAPHQVTADLKLELHAIDAMHLSEKLAQLLVLEYNLVCTVIDNIPSINYHPQEQLFDADMFHLRDIHLDMANEYPEAIRDVRIQDSFYTKMHLSWSYHQFEITDIITSMTRITPANIKTPGAMRLIQHLYMGKKILLEYQVPNGFVIKYMLAVQDGDIFLHTLMIPREVPALMAVEIRPFKDDDDTKTKSDTDTIQSEIEMSCSFSKCSDTDTATAPGSDSTKFNESNTEASEDFCNYEQEPLDLSKKVPVEESEELELPYKQSILYSPYVKQLLNNFLSVYSRYQITKEQGELCCKAIETLRLNEKKYYNLNLPRDHFYRTAPKRKQYQVLWDEMQQYLEDNLFSAQHEIVYNYFNETVRSDSDTDFSDQSAPSSSTSVRFSSDGTAERPSSRVNLLDYLKKTEKTQRSQKDKKRGKK